MKRHSHFFLPFIAAFALSTLTHTMENASGARMLSDNVIQEICCSYFATDPELDPCTTPKELSKLFLDFLNLNVEIKAFLIDENILKDIAGMFLVHSVLFTKKCSDDSSSRKRIAIAFKNSLMLKAKLFETILLLKGALYWTNRFSEPHSALKIYDGLSPNIASFEHSAFYFFKHGKSPSSAEFNFSHDWPPWNEQIKYGFIFKIPGGYQFTHRVYQDFFVARYLISCLRTEHNYKKTSADYAFQTSHYWQASQDAPTALAYIKKLKDKAAFKPVMDFILGILVYYGDDHTRDLLKD